MTAPTKWRDALGREWQREPSGHGVPIGWDLEFGDGIAWHVVVSLCGPLEPIEPMARVRFPKNDTFATNDEYHIVRGWGGCIIASWPLSRAEEIAAAFRTLGYTDATVEVVE